MISEAFCSSHEKYEDFMELDWIEFNMNQYVRVKLTPRGIEFMKEKHQLMYDAIRMGVEFVPPEVDSEGYSTFQLWSLMHEFGSHITMGCPILFETDILFSREKSNGSQAT